MTGYAPDVYRKRMQWTIFCNGFERLKSVQIVDLPSSHINEKMRAL